MGSEMCIRDSACAVASASDARRPRLTPPSAKPSAPRARKLQGVRAFIGGHQRLVNYWILHRSYSIGIGDTIADARTMDDIVATIDESKREVSGSRMREARRPRRRCGNALAWHSLNNLA